MAKAYYSTVFERPAPEVWKIVRDFNHYPVWVGGAGESRIEDGKSGDAVGAVRSVLYQERRIRQRLLALSDVERSQTYEFCGPASLPLTGFQATLRITPVVHGNHAFVEWWATFDCDAARRDELTGTLQGWFGIAARHHGPPPRQVPGRCRGHGRLIALHAPFRSISANWLRYPEFWPVPALVRLLHSRAAFGIALPLTASDRRQSDAGVAQW